jgi:hypothetical protein
MYACLLTFRCFYFQWDTSSSFEIPSCLGALGQVVRHTETLGNLIFKILKNMWLTKLEVECGLTISITKSDLSLLDQEDEIVVRTLFFHSYFVVMTIHYFDK